MKNNTNEVAAIKKQLEKKMQKRFPGCLFTTVVTFWQDNTFQVCIQNYDSESELPYRRYWYKSSNQDVRYEESAKGVPFSN